MIESRTLCVNGQTHFHRIKQVDVPPHLDLLAWLEGQCAVPKVYWKCRDGRFEVAAAGSLLMLDKAPQFHAQNDSPARFWGGHAFFPSIAPKDAVWSGFPRTAFFLPKIEIIRRGTTTQAVIQSLGGPIIEEIDFSHSHFSNPKHPVELVKHSPSSEDWTSLIQNTLAEIEKEELSKVVMARRTTHEGSVHPLELLSKLQAKGATHFAISFDKEKAFIGATPERLYRRQGVELKTEAIAGTRKLGSKEEQELLSSEKERREFNFVKTSLQEGLSPLCSTLACEKEDSILKTPNVQHLHNQFEGKLRADVSDGQILSALHPTAAMGGLPRRSALEHLIDHEPFERGWYASPIGYISQAEAEFVVGIRSCLIEEGQLHFFAGAGIVAGSEAEKEWDELEHKTSLWKGVLA